MYEGHCSLSPLSGRYLYYFLHSHILFTLYPHYLPRHARMNLLGVAFKHRVALQGQGDDGTSKLRFI